MNRSGSQTLTKTYYGITEALANSDSFFTDPPQAVGSDFFRFRLAFQLRVAGTGNPCEQDGMTYFDRLSIIARISAVQLYRNSSAISTADNAMSTIYLPTGGNGQLVGSSTVIRYIASIVPATNDEMWSAEVIFSKLDGYFKNDSGKLTWNSFQVNTRVRLEGKIILL